MDPTTAGLSRYLRKIALPHAAVRHFFFLLCLLIPALYCPAEDSRPSASSFLLKLFPPRAAVRVDSRLVPEEKAANGWRRLTLPSGEVTLSLHAPGYYEKKITVRVPRDSRMEVTLQRRITRFVHLQTLPTGSGPKSVRFSPDGGRMVVCQLAGVGIDLYGTTPPAHLRTIPLPPGNESGTGFVESAFTPEGKEVWISQMTTAQVHILDGKSFDYIESLDTGGLWSKVILFSQKGSYAFVSNWISRDVSVIDVKTRKLLHLLPTSGIPRGVALSPDEKRLFVCIFSSGNIDIFNLETWEREKTLQLGPGAARHIVSAPEKNHAYVSDMHQGVVYRLPFSTEKPEKKRWIGNNVNTIALFPEEGLLLASVRGINNPLGYTRKGPEFGKVVVLDTDTLAPIDWLWGSNQPTGLDISPGGKTLAYTNLLDDTLVVYHLMARPRDEGLHRFSR